MVEQVEGFEGEGLKALGNVVRIDEEKIKGHLDRIVRGSVEETLNALHDAEAQRMCHAGRYERTEERKDYRSGHYERQLHTKAGPVTLKVPKLRRQTLETAIIERYRRRESSVEEALMEMYLAGVSVRRVEDITEALWGTRVSTSTVSALNKKIYATIDAWRSQPIEGEHPCVYLDGIVMKRTWAGEVRAVSLLVAVGVNQDGYREILGICEGAKEDKAGWQGFLKHLKERGLSGVELVVSDACMGLKESIHDFYPDARWQRCVVHMYRNVFSHVPAPKMRGVALQLKAIHAQESREAARAKADEVIAGLRAQKLTRAAEILSAAVDETLAYYAFPSEHWRRLRTNNPLERLMREIRRRTRVVGGVPGRPIVSQPGHGQVETRRWHRMEHQALHEHGAAQPIGRTGIDGRLMDREPGLWSNLRNSPHTTVLSATHSANLSESARKKGKYSLNGRLRHLRQRFCKAI